MYSSREDESYSYTNWFNDIISFIRISKKSNIRLILLTPDEDSVKDLFNSISAQSFFNANIGFYSLFIIHLDIIMTKKFNPIPDNGCIINSFNFVEFSDLNNVYRINLIFISILLLWLKIILIFLF